MAMTNRTAPNHQPDSKNHLKNVVEQSLAVLCESGESAKMMKAQPGLASRRSLPLHVDPANLQTRALGDAAKALAELWKLSRPGRERVPRRAMPNRRPVIATGL